MSDNRPSKLQVRIGVVREPTFPNGLGILIATGTHRLALTVAEAAEMSQALLGAVDAARTFIAEGESDHAPA